MLQNITKASKILHNMIIEDEWDENEAINFDYEQVDEILIHNVEQTLSKDLLLKTGFFKLQHFTSTDTLTH